MHLKNLFMSQAWYNLVPDMEHEVIVDGYGSGDTYAAAARSMYGKLVVIYVPNNRKMRVNMTTLSDIAKAVWYDPTNGKYREMGRFDNNGSKIFDAPGPNSYGESDWILVLETQDR